MKMRPVVDKLSKIRSDSPFTITSTLRISIFSLIASCSVLVCSLLIQWFVYYDWLHETGPFRIIGTCLAAFLTFGFVYRWQMEVRERQLQMLRRFETIARMNDRVRNALQTIECVTYLSRPEATESVREAVDAIDGVLREVLADVAPFERIAEPEPCSISEKIKQQSA
jgi:hypothetical protein